MNENSIKKIISAVAFAAQKHSDQRRKDHAASPYINHPIALAEVLTAEANITDPDILCAAILHDTLEDTETTPSELEERFGKRIALIVSEVTDDKSLPREERKRLQIVHAAAASREAKLVKLADKICNLRDIIAHPPHDWDATRKQEYFDWAKLVIAGVRGTNEPLERLFDELCAKQMELN